MRTVNIKSLLQAHASLSQECFSKFLNHFGIEIRTGEVEDLKVLAEALSAIDDNIRHFDGYYFGYNIPQIGKEFDLLRFGTNYVVNIELKKISTEDKIKKQLLKNKYYLKFIGKKIINFTFVSSSADLFILNDDGNLEKVELGELLKMLNDQQVNDIENLDSLFNPSDYLVSPFNSTAKFLKNEYFLTGQQDNVKEEILTALINSKTAKFFSITGSAGTGKTLLIYDIVKNLRQHNNKPLIVHCGQLNSGQEELNRNGWKIFPVKHYLTSDFANCNVTIVDEAQRLRPEQLNSIVDNVNATNSICIFSYDKTQTLGSREDRNDISSKINSINSIVTYKLTDKIRTNREIATFIRMLFNKEKVLPLKNNGNIEINYFKNIEDAKSYLEALDGDKWETLQLTPSQYNREYHDQYSCSYRKTSHQVIGQEFDGVAIVIDKYFSYDDKGKLTYLGSAYYNPPKMLFQNITRTRKRLNLIIIDNEEMLDRCIAVLQ